MNAVLPVAPDLLSYETIIVAFSGGKDSIACLLRLLDLGIDPSRIELWHHDVDGQGRGLMDWPSTLPYIRAIAAAFDVPLYCSWRNGGFEAEMLRDGTPTGMVWFDTPIGMMSSGGKGPTGTRLRFPQVSADLSVRWCSSVLKVDVMDRAIRGQSRFLNTRTLVITGERADESPNRARYAPFEPHRSDTRHGTRRRRHVDHWRPVHALSEQQVWDRLRLWQVMPALPYQIGFSRLSCRACVFMSASHAATLRTIAPANFTLLAQYEQRFGCTIKRAMSLDQLADRGQVFPIVLARPDLVELAQSDAEWSGSIRTSPWMLPPGAFGEAFGPN